MKKIFLTFCLLISSVILASADDDYVINFNQLPATSQAFINTHFAKIQVSVCLRDSHSFEVKLSDASEVEFYLNGVWKEVDCKYKGLPASVIGLIPDVIPTYIKSNFPNATMTKVSSKTWGYEIELDNGLELEFNRKGQLTKIDD